MASFNPLQLQHQIRQNSTELASYLSDLNAWQKDIKSKENELQAGRLTLSKPSSSSSSAPPVRSCQPHVTLRDTAAEDAERCEQRRQEGNRLYAAGKWQEAMSCYSSCVILQPSDPLPLSNRAQCSLKLGSWKAAEEDCDAALLLDPKHVKSLFRRATARKQLGKTQAALQDLKQLLQLDADNKQAKQLQAEMEKESTSLASGDVKAKADMDDGKQGQRQRAPAAGRPEQPRRKVIIQEDDDEDDEEKEDSSSVRAEQEEHKEQLQLSTPQPQPATTAANTAAQPMAVDSGSRSQRAGSSQAAVTSSTVSSLPSQPPPPRSSAPVPGVASTMGSPTASGSAASSSSPASAPASSASAVRPPRSAMEFDSRYRGVRSQPGLLSELLLLVPAAEYPTILRTALDASLLGNVLLAISQHLMPRGEVGGVWHVLSALPAVPRFSLVLSFLSAKDRQTLVSAFQLLLARPPPRVESEAIRRTAAAYGVELR